MNLKLQHLFDSIQQSEHLTIDEKNSLSKALKEVDKEMEIVAFKLDRTEKVKKTTAILLEETIAELEQKRKAVEAQNRELEIETGLERVRARAMAMQKSDELKELIGTVFTELTKLDLVLTRCLIMIYDPATNDTTWWMANSEAPSDPIGLIVQYHEHPPYLAYVKAWEEKKLKWEFVLEGKIKKDWDDFLFIETELSHLPDFVIAGMKAPDRVYLNSSFNSFGNLTLATLDPLSDEHFDIMLRFAKVFDLTYTRFNDLLKAEALAREATIEVALERVRSRSMGMQKSEELKEVIQVVYEQFVHLKILIEHTGFIMDYKARDDMNIWLADQHQVPFQVTIPYFDCAHWNSFNEAKEKGMDFFANHLSFEEKNRFYQDLFKVIPGVPKETTEYYFSCPGLAISTVLLENIGLYIENFSGIPYSDEENTTLMRFGKVFQQTYTRFLDLKKAEAQAREAQIENALEKVRSRSLAMHKSDEMEEVLHAVFERLKELGIDFYTAIIILFKKDSKDIEWWLESKANRLYPRIQVPYSDIDYLRNLFEARENGMNLFSKCYLFEEKNDLFHHLFDHTDFKYTPEEQKYFLLQTEFATMSVALAKNTGIHITSYSRRSFSEEDNEVLKKFAKVFDQAYTRFLDLQNAEVQARESQIELGLERVRARAMAMQGSNELSDLVDTFLKELVKLDFALNWCIINIIDVSTMSNMVWAANPDIHKAPDSYHMKFEDYPFHDAMMKGYQERKTKFIYVIEGDEKKIYDEYLFKETAFRKVPEEAQAASRAMEKYVCSFTFSNFGGLQTVGNEPLSDINLDILERFGKVFDLTYTRFNDLLKAEAQAREAKIEAVLERVRSRTMAMQKSDELTDVAGLLFEQVSAMGIKTWTAGFNVWSADNNSYVDYITSPQGGFIEPYTVYTETAEALTDISNARKSGVEFDVQYVEGEKIKQLYLALTNLDEKQYEIMLQDGVRFPSHQYEHFVFGSKVSLMFITYEPVPEAHDIFKRLGKVFEQTYTRFLDLQNAEAQARESQIQLALERVRARTMAMQKSDELPQAANLLFQQIQSLGMPAWSAGYCIWDDDKQAITLSMSSEGVLQPMLKMPLTEDPSLKHFREAYERGESFFVEEVGGEALKEHYAYLRTLPGVKETLDDIEKAGFPVPTFQIFHLAYFTQGFLLFITYEQVPESHDIFKRFGKVFEQTYTRFLDLQKAEAQAREAQIEVALERVRSRAMAMQNSNELSALVAVLFEELTKLNLILNRCIIWIFDADTFTARIWMANSEDRKNAESYFIKKLNHPYYDAILNAWKEKKPKWVYELQGNNKKTIDRLLLTETELANLPEIVKEGILSSEHTIVSGSFNNFGLIEASGPVQQSDEQLEILNRFGKVFDLTYTRFNDLQNAEAQAREAQIELALERVRARTMAMQHSDELKGAAALLFQQVKSLGVPAYSCGYNIWEKDDNKFTSWMSTQDGSDFNAVLNIPLTEDANFIRFAESRKKGEQFFVLELRGERMQEHYQYLKTIPDFKAYFDYAISVGFNLPETQIHHLANFSQGNLLFITLEPCPEFHDVFKRFASVFEQTYTRFLDLQKAEALAREATIEAALERVRGKALAMHSSTDLVTTIGVFYHELEGLNLTPRRCGVGLINKEMHTAEISTMNATGNGQSIELIGKLDLTTHPILKGVYSNWLTKTEFHPVLHGNEIKEYYQLLRPQVAFPDYPNDLVQYGYFFFFEEGGVYAWTEKQLQEDELKIYRRFTSVLSLTYKRYKDLKDAEARTQAAIKEAALDRIRADIASMRTINDLDRITPLIWNELTVLGIPFIRCGVFIMDESQQLIHTFLSTPDGKSIAAFHLPYDTPGNLKHVIANWKENKSYIDHWDEVEFIQFAYILVQQGTLASPEQYLKTIPQGGFYLHFLPFLQGMLYVGNITMLNEDELQLIQHVADAFSTAYARYEDFNKLEAAKQQVEKTLTDLKQAQQQLVQSEKMASLGELTAGIAHEIQNPLNFVNNFSDVSSELLEEMKMELEKGNAANAIALVEDVKQNLQKILHHGKRADAIVKGMLQHSRNSSGQKELADINVLADEYIRLCYHGLRAKDKSFNATIKTDFDETLDKANIIPQDIGRVILNLLTNAFYAANEKRKEGKGGFEPTVAVSTRRINNKIEISVKDNGNGISQKVLDKIFQPFFTTKPTGQGTGLGLSLSYDIIKAHGGELKVETNEGDGTEFIIQLPMN